MVSRYSSCCFQHPAVHQHLHIFHFFLLDFFFSRSQEFHFFGGRAKSGAILHGQKRKKTKNYHDYTLRHILQLYSV